MVFLNFLLQDDGNCDCFGPFTAKPAVVNHGNFTKPGTKFYNLPCKSSYAVNLIHIYVIIY